MKPKLKVETSLPIAQLSIDEGSDMTSLEARQGQRKKQLGEEITCVQKKMNGVTVWKRKKTGDC